MLAVPAESGRGRALALLVLAVLALHAALLAGIDGVGLSDAPAVPAVQVRSVPARPDPPVIAPAPTAAPAAPVARPRQVRTERRVPAAAPADIAPIVDAPAPAASSPEVPRAEAPIEEPLSTSVAAPSPAASATIEPADTTGPVDSVAADPELPTYRTLLPPPAVLRYDLQRGRFGGSGELRWQPDGGRYALSLDGSVVGIQVLTQLSQGGIDGAGLAPERFTDQRARRPVQAANFRRDVGKVTFSGPSHELPLRAGVQDRLSWMIQLAAIAAADPRLREPDARVALQVIGARGDAGIWVFRCLGPVPLETAGGTLDTLRYAREPRSPYDTAVEVWLDPARHHLPVRATTRNGAEGDGLELRLRDATILH